MLFLLFLVETTKMKETSQSTSATKNRRKKIYSRGAFSSKFGRYDNYISRLQGNTHHPT